MLGLSLLPLQLTNHCPWRPLADPRPTPCNTSLRGQEPARGVKLSCRKNAVDRTLSANVIDNGWYVNIHCQSHLPKGYVASCLAASRQRQGRRDVASMALMRGHERLPRKYVCGVVPSIVRNISMKALTLS